MEIKRRDKGMEKGQRKEQKYTEKCDRNNEDSKVKEIHQKKKQQKERTTAEVTINKRKDKRLVK